ncbi:S-layer homology domain-containing protein [Paenibacillus gansuensis]|uniref:S-layer homology domain-containing protein n=1 Tax=Paenibacillus gansuensis TaxID=306542 RepID=A0ABW5P7J1_9BACL
MKKKQIVPTLLTAALLAAPILPVRANAAVNFSDIGGSYAKDAILQLAQQGIISGGSGGNFDPTGKISRQDFAIILAKALQLEITSKPPTATFSDVPQTHYSYSYIEAAVKAGLVKGTGNGAFGMDQNLSRQEMAALFVRALGVDVSGEGKAFKFADSNSISSWAKDAVAFAVKNQLITLNSNNEFNGTKPVDRQTVAQAASQFIKVHEEVKSQKPEPKPEQPKPGQSKPETPSTPAPQPSNPQPTNPEPTNPTPPADTTAPLVDTAQFTLVDNYNGIQDQLKGAIGAVGEAGATVKVYRWDDEVEPGIINSEDLGEPVTIGTSDSAGAVGPGNIGDLKGGMTYKFIITATDAAGNESPRDLQHVLTLTPEKEEAPELPAETVTSTVYGFSWRDITDLSDMITEGSIVPSLGINANQQIPVRLLVKVNEAFVNGTLEITLSDPTSYALNKWLPKDAIGDQIDNKVTISGINAEANSYLYVNLETILFEGTYHLSFQTDADGSGVMKTMSKPQQVEIRAVVPR